ncbi:hypothetical protein LCGC14_3006850 [marine sediment metagenome]|uniref:DNA methylase N-4/N-6 domain-containing protein n=1 Tax=marine sediment metagenome TaxID=412755 RepID=A0A0F8ZQL5_9ZZZZ
MRIAYADPPYVGQARKLYQSEEVDHKALIGQLEGYDGWALSASTPSLRYLLPLCPEKVRVAAWVKPFCAFKPNVNPAYTWEPVLFVPARSGRRDIPTVKDHVSTSITLKKGLTGAKPTVFCYWLFSLLGMEQGDDFDDMFPGTGIVSRCWENWQRLGS